ncbi:MAG: FtsX-like permease family protein [Campylobacterota bacterium]|nr:FtsX-like permease family protein [Campylobacterota bacterium]
MRDKINLHLIEYAIGSIMRQGHKSVFITIVFTMLTALLTSVFFITNSMKYELNATVDALPEIIVQNTKASRHTDISIESADLLLDIPGVSSVNARVWGYYYFANAGVNFTLVGIDEFEEQYSSTLENVVKKSEFDSTGMYVGQGVRKIMSSSYYKEYFNFIKPDGTIKKVDILGVFDSEIELESNDIIVMSKDNLREIFGIEESEATDLVIKVANIEEIENIALKIEQLFPNARVITNDDMKLSYENIFNYKSGVFLALFVISIFTFFIIIYDKMSGLSSEQKREVGILKAIGWRVEDVLKSKFYESLILSLFAYFLGVILAMAYVYIFNAPLLSDIFIGYSDLKPLFKISFVLDLQTLFLVFFLSVPVYIAATIIPSWKVATLEADEVIR